jgi:ABC-type glycerol-3-phosphate transport system substrate-binding protein
VGVAPLPTLRGTQPTTLVRAEVAAINAVTTDQQRRAAEAFLRYATGAEAQTRLAEQSRGAVLPAHTGVPVDAHGEAMRVAAEHGQSFTGALDATWQPLDTMINSVVNGGDAGEAVDKASTQVGNREQGTGTSVRN